MRALILAAGVGRRLEPFTDDRPKCLMTIAGKSLLVRHLDILAGFPQLEGLDIVVGYRHDQIRDAVAVWQRESERDFPVRFYMNEAFRKGSILSLYTGKETLVSEDTIVMDADVLYPKELMRRLLESDERSCVLIDEQADMPDEEMVICCRDDRAMHIARSRHPSTHGEWDEKGEGVGFLKLDHTEAPKLITIIEEAIAAGQEDADYEDTIASFMKVSRCGYERIGDLPWTEIDFSEDLVSAEEEILPAIRAYEAGK